MLGKIGTILASPVKYFSPEVYLSYLVILNVVLNNLLATGATHVS